MDCKFEIRVATSSLKHLWNKVWRLNRPPKLKHFIWKALRGILPSKAVIVKRVDRRLRGYDRCGKVEESLEHVLTLQEYHSLVTDSIPR
ncbi:conserved hypothetical protein [Ricinus communis]|uniref:Reverse transcriptase zinc-binding domain-containing protein n=1 Tax=Ricinus communis TaxID=3988 RepID=B9SIM0_RICCO|nr:conserved hypothetical protein [Ricinus communis]